MTNVSKNAWMLRTTKVIFFHIVKSTIRLESSLSLTGFSASSLATLGSNVQAMEKMMKTIQAMPLKAPLQPNASMRAWHTGLITSNPAPTLIVTNPVANERRFTK